MKLFIKNDCPNCHEMMIFLDENQIKYETLNVDEDFEALAEIIEQGIMETPVMKHYNKFYTGVDIIDYFTKKD